jgi:peptidyl-prolyl cis-trans isomerase D
VLQSMRSAAKYIFWLITISFIGGFIFVETSGLLGRNVTRGTAVGRVNGQPISFDVWDRTVRTMTEQAQREGRALTLDDQRRIEDAAFQQLVTDVLLRSELDRRGITVTVDEIRQAALTFPPPELANAPELQTEGRFDPEKYQRYLRSPAARQQGLLAYLEGYYRSEIPRQKLASRLTAGVHVTDAQLWTMWQDQHDSAEVSYVALSPTLVPDSTVRVSDAETRAYYEAHKAEFDDRPGRAVVSILALPRTITAADSAASRARAVALRNEIVGGAKFEDVAKRESSDSVSAEQGGSLGRVTKETAFVPEFKDAAFKLRVGEISEPVATRFGFHLIKVDEKRGDTLALRHILVKIQQSDSTASATDRRADDLSTAAAEADDPRRFDDAAKQFRLQPVRVEAREGDPVVLSGEYVPDVSAWAFGGAKPGETSSLIEAPSAYFLARLDTLRAGGKPTFEALRDEIRRTLMREKQVDALVPRAQRIATAVAAGSTLEQAAQANGLTVQRSGLFTRTSGAPGLGRANEAVGAAFGLPVGAVSAPIKTRTGVYVIRVERRTRSDRAAWEAQKDQQRNTVLEQTREQRVQQFMGNLRREAKVVDDRRKIRERQQTVTS